MKFLAFLSVVFSSLALVNSHTWVDNIKVTGGAGPIDGSLGYIRGYVGHRDDMSSYLIPAPGNSVYRPNQREPNQPDGKFGRLKASPGSEITAEWHENGHTTNDTPENNAPGYDPGKVYMYGTISQPNPDLSLEQIWKWTAESPLTGRYLGMFNYDDGRCAEEGSQGRPKGAPRWAAGGGGPCKGKFNLPEDLQPGQVFTVFWVWDFSTKVPGGKHFEWYSSVMDIDIIPKQGNFPVEKPTSTVPSQEETGTPTPIPVDDDDEEETTPVDDDDEEETTPVDNDDGEDDKENDGENDGENDEEDDEIVDIIDEDDQLVDDNENFDDEKPKKNKNKNKESKLDDDNLDSINDDNEDDDDEDDVPPSSPSPPAIPELPLVKRSAKFRAW